MKDEHTDAGAGQPPPAQDVMPYLVSSPWADLLASGMKNVEGRAGKAEVFPHVGEHISFVGPDGKDAGPPRQVVAKVEYPNFESYLATCWERSAPQCKNQKQAREVHPPALRSAAPITALFLG